jgi:hypothetical protein
LLANIPTYIQENQQQREESYSEREIRENEEREAEDRKQDLLKILQVRENFPFLHEKIQKLMLFFFFFFRKNIDPSSKN